VLRTCGVTKRNELDADEEMLVMRTLRDMNLSKLVFDDVNLFSALISDIFPKQKEPSKNVNETVENAIAKVFEEMHLLNKPSF
jgi:dynein heavy chain